MGFAGHFELDFAVIFSGIKHGSNDMALWSSHKSAAIQDLVALKNPKHFEITSELVYKWIVSDQVGKDEIIKMLS